MLLSAVVYLSGRKQDEAEVDFTTALQKAPLFSSKLSILPSKKIDYPMLDVALDALCSAKFLLKKQIIAACISGAASDGKFSIEESEILRAIASSLDCPLPPMLSDSEL